MMGRIDDRQLQQLVDGELEEPSYRETLTALAEEPDGWRRCALAFLEDQMLRRQLVCEPENSAMNSAAPKKLGKHSHAISLLLAIAASFTLAFVIGYEMNQWRAANLMNQLAAETSKTQDSPASDDQKRDSLNGQHGWESYASDQPLSTVKLVVDGPDGTRGQSIDVPIYALDSNWSQWLVDNRSSLPEQVYDELEKTGRAVHRSQFLAPVDLQDGSQLVIPVEQIEITPVSQPY